MRAVPVDTISPARLTRLLSRERAERVGTEGERARRLLEGRTVWNISSTATGGGVAEMLPALLAYTRGAGTDTRWAVLDGEPDFFTLTKRIHNLLHGTDGDGGPTGEDQRRLYQRVLADNLADLREQVHPGDLVVLHDPQTAGMVTALREAGALVVWRSHVGRDEPNEQTDRAWRFLRPYVEHADRLVFSREAYVPDWVDAARLHIIAPSLDPYSPKNAEMSEADVEATLRTAGLVDLPGDDGSLDFSRRDGGEGRVRDHDDLVVAGGPVPGDARLVVQVSRWDRLKDMAGVLDGFCQALPELPDGVHLALVGPSVAGVSDDPEGAEVLAECTERWKGLPEDVGERVHLVCLPMDDVDENAHLVNALQRRAAVVVQKSFVEGFGLTVTEPMWKARPVLASRVGGIQDQIVDGESGVLLDDPADLRAFGQALVRLLGDQDRAEQIGAAAKERVRDQYLGDRHLIQYVDLFDGLLAQQR